MIQSTAMRSISIALLEKAEKLGQTKRMIVFVATTVLLFGGYIFLLHMPKSTEVDRLEGVVEDLNQKLRLAKIRASKIDQFRAEFARTEEKLKEALKLLPDRREIPSLLKSITQVGIDSKLDFILFKPGDEKAQNFYMEIPVAIEVKGDFREVARFFDEVRRMERVVNIQNITMKPEKELSTQLITRCNALTYRFKTKADIEKENKQKKGKKKK